MSTRLKLWLVPALLYGFFVFWYTDLGGPLEDAEINEYLAAMTAAGSPPEELAMIRKFAEEDSGSQLLMLNAFDYTENPPDVAGAEPGESAQQLMGRYMGHMLPALLSRASHPVVMGNAIAPSMDLVGIAGAENWDGGALFRYRSRRTLLDIASNPAFAGNHEFKLAALDKTIAYPIEPKLYLGDLRLILGLVLLSITALFDGWLLSRRLSGRGTPG